MNNGASNYLFDWLRSMNVPEAAPTRSVESYEHGEGEETRLKSALERWQELTNIINR
ncbi:MAG TPA: hypothetical protein VMV68_10740 [Spirochaetia bacterium]|nr:hypothetical protein [Spirochaetia bacterium]